MKRKIRIMALAAVAGFLAACATTGENGGSTYDTTGKPGALGIKAQVSYPAGFMEKGDGIRPSIIQTFRRQADGLDEYLLLQAMELGDEAGMFFGEASGFDDSPRQAKWRHVLGSVSGMRVVALRAATLDGRSAVIADLAVNRTGQEGGVSLRSRMMMVQDADRMLVLTCGVSGRADEGEKVGFRQKTNTESLCRDYFGSLRWVK